MANYKAPGVYVEEVESANRPIEGVGTSTAAFIGVVSNDIVMPIMPDDSSYSLAAADKAIKITNWEQFKNNFGDFQKVEGAVETAEAEAHAKLAHAVYGFFNNGGTVCYVLRVATTPVDDFAAALKILDPIDDIAIVAIPGATDSAIQNAIIAHCTRMKDRFAILDGVSSATLTPATICSASVSDDGYGAVYYPNLMVTDPVSGDEVAVAPSGHIAGVYARTDSERGVHKVPANESILGVQGVEFSISKTEHGLLNDANINAIRLVNGSVKVFGGRCWVSASETMYINVRRLLNAIRESIDEGTQWATFEPNDSALWKKIRRNVTAYLTNVWRDGALFGASASEAFYVKCDEETNPSEVRDLGQVVTEIGVALTKPAEFVVFKISQS